MVARGLYGDIDYYFRKLFLIGQNDGENGSIESVFIHFKHTGEIKFHFNKINLNNICFYMFNVFIIVPQILAVTSNIKNLTFS